MTETSNTPTPSNEAQSQPQAPRMGKSRRWLIGGALAATALVGFGVAAAQSQGGFGHHGFGGRHFGGFDPTRMEARIDFGADIILGRAGANPEQRQKVTAILKSLAREAPEFRRQNLAAREQMVNLLKADRIDRAAIEKLRAERIKALDDASRKVTDALAQAGEILTAEQRRELVSLAEKRRSMMGMWR